MLLKLKICCIFCGVPERQALDGRIENLIKKELRKSLGRFFTSSRRHYALAALSVASLIRVAIFDESFSPFLAVATLRGGQSKHRKVLWSIHFHSSQSRKPNFEFGSFIAESFYKLKSLYSLFNLRIVLRRLKTKSGQPLWSLDSDSSWPFEV